MSASDRKPSPDDIAVVDNADASRYEIRVDGVVAGYADYRDRGGAFAVNHTVTDPAFQGRGLASRLVRAMLDDLRARGVGILPYCPFVRDYLARHPDDLDLVPEGRRAQFDLG